MHRRRIVRDALAEQLAGLALTGDRVFVSRTRPIPEKELPALRVYTTGEAAEPEGETLSYSNPTHRIQVRIEVLAKAADDVQDLLDDVCEQVEAAIDSDPTLGGAANWCAYQGTDLDFEDEDQAVMQASINYEVLKQE